jgi:SAM-dependent methyltransferase
MPSINRLEPYTALADVYQAAGLAAYSVELAPHLLDIAFELEWTGRTLLDLACGTGDLACWFAEHNLRTTGVDTSAQMMRFGSARSEKAGTDATFVVGDIRTYQYNRQADFVMCLGGSLNYIPTLRDLESVFRLAHAALVPGKLFIFDIQTIHGLATDIHTDHVVFDNKADAMIIAHDSFNFENLALTRQYTILRYTDRTGWQRAEETHILRGYPIQAVVSLLGKTGFKLIRTILPDLSPADGQPDAAKLIFVATRDG